MLRQLPVFVLLLSIAGLVRAQDKTDLAWKFEKDKSFFQELTTKTTQAIKVQGLDVNQIQEQTFYFKWTPVKQDGDKWQVKQVIEGVKMKIDIAGNPITFDSTNATATANTALSEFFKALVGAEFTLTLNKDMKVEKVEGRDEFLKKLSAANQQMEPLLKKILSEEALKQMADPTFGIMKKDAKKDEKWVNEVKLDLGPIGSYATTYNYTYKGKDATKTDLDRIETTVNLVYTAPKDSDGSLPFKIVGADLKASDKSAGTILFNTKLGRVETMDLNIKVNGTLNVEIGGQKSTVELSQDQTTSVKTASESFVNKPAVTAPVPPK